MAIAVGAAALACGAAGAALYKNRPRDPIFEVVNIELKGFNVRFHKLMAVVDAQLVLTIKVINPNVTPIEYTSTTMDIFYRGVLLGQALVEAGDQGPCSEELIQVTAKLDGLEMTKNLKELLSDVRKREMIMNSVVTIKGHARLWKWTHDFVGKDGGRAAGPWCGYTSTGVPILPERRARVDGSFDGEFAGYCSTSVARVRWRWK